MGNEASLAEEKKESTSPASNDAPAGGLTTSGSTFGSNQALLISPKSGSRRIIKAKTPDSTGVVVIGGDHSETENGDGSLSNDNSDNGNGTIRTTKKAARDHGEGSSGALEAELEKMEQQKQGRLEEMQTSQRAKREKRLDERRKKHQSSNGKSNGDTVQPQFNPFSRFLSAFSVHSHPEHKRPYVSSQSEDDLEPTVKKARQQEEEDDDKNGGALSGGSTVAIVVAAVVAIAVGVWMRAAKQR